MAKLGQNSRVNSDQLIQTILADPEVADFISRHHLSQEQINLSLSKFNQFLVERQKYQLKDDSYIAKGYQPILAMNEGYADVSYLETKELVEAQKQAAISERIQLVSLPKSYRHIHLSDIDVNNASRMEAFSAILDFVEQYPSVEQKDCTYMGTWGLASLTCWLLWLMNCLRKKVSQPLFCIFRALPLMLKMPFQMALLKKKLMR